MKRPKDDLTDELSLELLPPEPSKGDKTRLRIVEAAIRNYATIGYDKTTPQKIADTAKLSRPLIIHYFKDADGIFALALRYIRLRFQRMAIQSIRLDDTPSEQLESYVRSTFAWARAYPDHARIWLYFYYAAALDEKLKALNTEMAEMGRLRIAAILDAGTKLKLWRFKNAGETAKLIQVIITGTLVVTGTETLPFAETRLEENTVKLILSLPDVARRA